jgi:uncharacterized protein
MKIKRRTFLQYAGAGSLGAVTMGGGSAWYGMNMEPDWLEVVTEPIQLARLDPAFHGYRIVQLSDIHADTTWMDAQRLSHIVQIANAQNPDLILITGDFATYQHKRMNETLSTLKALQAPDGVFSVLGNRDYVSDPQVIRGLLPSYGIQDLKDRVHTIYHGSAMLHLVGLDDLWGQTDEYSLPLDGRKAVLTSLVKSLPTEGAAILLVHEPDFADFAATTRRIDLQLSGHTHGGQIRLPGYGALHLPRLGKRYQAGLYHVNNMLHYTNRGLGMMSPQVRFNCRPEITVFVCQGNL